MVSVNTTNPTETNCRWEPNIPTKNAKSGLFSVSDIPANCPFHPALLIMCSFILQLGLVWGPVRDIWNHVGKCTVCAVYLSHNEEWFWGVRATAPWLSLAGWGVGAVLPSAHHLARGRLCLGKRPLPGLNYGGNNPGHTEAITAPYKSICFGLKSDLLPTLWRGSDSVGLWFFWEMRTVSLKLGRAAALAAVAVV